MAEDPRSALIKAEIRPEELTEEDAVTLEGFFMADNDDEGNAVERSDSRIGPQMEANCYRNGEGGICIGTGAKMV